MPVEAAEVNNLAPDYLHMSHADLLNLRNSLPPDDPRQPMLAQYEHMAFAREWTKENPVIAPLSLLGAIPMYSGAKALGLIHSRTPASLGELAWGVNCGSHCGTANRPIR